MKIKLMLTSLGVIASSSGAAVSMTSCKSDDDIIWIKGKTDTRILRGDIVGYHMNVVTDCLISVEWHFIHVWYLDLKDNHSEIISKSQLEELGYDTSVSPENELKTLNIKYEEAVRNGERCY